MSTIIAPRRVARRVSRASTPTRRHNHTCAIQNLSLHGYGRKDDDAVASETSISVDRGATHHTAKSSPKLRNTNTLAANMAAERNSTMFASRTAGLPLNSSFKKLARDMI